MVFTELSHMMNISITPEQTVLLRKIMTNHFLLAIEHPPTQEHWERASSRLTASKIDQSRFFLSQSHCCPFQTLHVGCCGH